jgi:hypothetical protein
MDAEKNHLITATEEIVAAFKLTSAKATQPIPSWVFILIGNQ